MEKQEYCVKARKENTLQDEYVEDFNKEMKNKMYKNDKEDWGE